MEDEDTKILIFRQPDPAEQSIRLICGGIFGLVVSLWLWLRIGLSLAAGVCLTTVLVIGCAYFARKYGDEFWYDTLRIFR